MGTSRKRAQAETDGENAEQSEVKDAAQKSPTSKGTTSTSTAASAVASTSNAGQRGSSSKRINGPTATDAEDSTNAVAEPLDSVDPDEAAFKQAIQRAIQASSAKRRRLAHSPAPPSAARKSVSALEILLASTSNSRSGSYGSATPQPSSSQAAPSPTASSSRTVRPRRVVSAASTSRSPAQASPREGRPKATTMSVKKERQAPSRKGKERAQSSDSEDSDSSSQASSQAAPDTRATNVPEPLRPSRPLPKTVNPAGAGKSPPLSNRIPVPSESPAVAVSHPGRKRKQTVPTVEIAADRSPDDEDRLSRDPSLDQHVVKGRSIQSATTQLPAHLAPASDPHADPPALTEPAEKQKTKKRKSRKSTTDQPLVAEPEVLADNSTAIQSDSGNISKGPKKKRRKHGSPRAASSPRAPVAPPVFYGQPKKVDSRTQSIPLEHSNHQASTVRSPSPPTKTVTARQQPESPAQASGDQDASRKAHKAEKKRLKQKQREAEKARKAAESAKAAEAENVEKVARVGVDEQQTTKEMTAAQSEQPTKAQKATSKQERRAAKRAAARREAEAEKQKTQADTNSENAAEAASAAARARKEAKLEAEAEIQALAKAKADVEAQAKADSEASARAAARAAEEAARLVAQAAQEAAAIAAKRTSTASKAAKKANKTVDQANQDAQSKEDVAIMATRALPAEQTQTRAVSELSTNTRQTRRQRKRARKEAERLAIQQDAQLSAAADAPTAKKAQTVTAPETTAKRSEQRPPAEATVPPALEAVATTKSRKSTLAMRQADGQDLVQSVANEPANELGPLPQGAVAATVQAEGAKEDDLTERESRKAAKKAAKRKEKKERKAAAEAEAQLAQQIAREESDVPIGLPSAVNEQAPSLTGSNAVDRSAGDVAPAQEETEMPATHEDAHQRPSSKTALRAVPIVLPATQKCTLQSEQADEESDSIQNFTDEDTGAILPARELLLDELSDTDATAFVMRDYFASDSSDWEEQQYETKIRVVKPVTPRRSAVKSTPTRQSSRARRSVSYYSDGDFEPPAAVPARSLRKRVDGKALTAVASAKKVRSASDTEDDGAGVSGIDSPSSSKTPRIVNTSQAVLADSSQDSSSEDDAEHANAQVAATSSLLALASQNSGPSSVGHIDDSRILLDSPSPSPEPKALRDSHAVLPITSPTHSMPPSEQTSIRGDSPASVTASANVEKEQPVPKYATSQPARSGVAPNRPNSALHALLARMDTDSGNDSSSSDGAYTTDGDISEPEKDERPHKSNAFQSRLSHSRRCASTSSSESDSMDESETRPLASAAVAPTVITSGPPIISAEVPASPKASIEPVKDAQAVQAVSIGIDETEGVAADPSLSQASEPSIKPSAADTEPAPDQVQDEVSQSSQADMPAQAVSHLGSPAPALSPPDGEMPALAVIAPDTEAEAPSSSTRQASSSSSPRREPAFSGLPTTSQPPDQPEVPLSSSADSALKSEGLPLSGHGLKEVVAPSRPLVPDHSMQEIAEIGSTDVLSDNAIVDVFETASSPQPVIETTVSQAQTIVINGSPPRHDILSPNGDSNGKELPQAESQVSPESLSRPRKLRLNPADPSSPDGQTAGETPSSQPKKIPTLSEISMAESPEKERFSSPDSPAISPGTASEGQEGPLAQVVHSSTATQIPDISVTDAAGADPDLSTELAKQSAPAMVPSSSFDSLHSSSSSSAMSQELLDAIKGFVEVGERATPPQRPENLSTVEGPTSAGSEEKDMAAVETAEEEQAPYGQSSKEEVVEQNLVDESIQTNHAVQEPGERTQTGTDVRQMTESGDGGEEDAPDPATAATSSAEPAAIPHEGVGTSLGPESALVVDNAPAEAGLPERDEISQQDDAPGAGVDDAPQLVIESPSPQKSSIVHAVHAEAANVAAMPDTPRRSARIASRSPSPSLDRASPVAASPSTKLYPSLAGLSAALTTVDEEARSGIDDVESATRPEARSDSLPDQGGAEENQEPVEDVDTATISRPRRFADMPASPPPLLTGFDTQSQIDQLASQPMPASPILEISRKVRGSSESSQSTGVASSLPFQENSQVAHLREDASMSNFPSPTASGNVSEQEVELSLINKKIPLFAPETPSASLEEANDVDSQLDVPSDSDDAEDAPQTNGHARQVSSSTQDSADVAPFTLSASPDSVSGANKTRSDDAAMSQRGRGQANYPASNVRSSNPIENPPAIEPRRSTYQLQPPNPKNAVMFRSRVVSQPTRPNATGEIPAFGIQPVSAYKSPPNKSSGRLASNNSTANLARNTSTPVTRASGFVAKPLSALASMATRPTRSSSRFSFSSAAVPAQSAAKKPLRRSEESDDEDSSSSSASEGEKDGSGKSQVPLGQRAGASKRSVSNKTKRGTLGAFASQK